MRILGPVVIGTTLLGGCGASGAGPVIADCTQQVRWQGRSYHQAGRTEHSATELGVAEQAECRDVGRGAPGPTFADDADQVRVWAFPELSPERVLGVRSGDASLAVFVVETTGPEEAERIVSELGERADRG